MGWLSARKPWGGTAYCSVKAGFLRGKTNTDLGICWTPEWGLRPAGVRTGIEIVKWCCSCLLIRGPEPMITDPPPRNSLLTAFQESDRITTLDLPADDHLPRIAESIETAMRDQNTARVRRA